MRWLLLANSLKMMISSYILAGLDADYNPFVESIYAKSDPVMLSRIEPQKATQQHHSQYVAANATSRGGRGFRSRGGRGGRDGGHSGASRTGRGGLETRSNANSAEEMDILSSAATNGLTM